MSPLDESKIRLVEEVISDLEKEVMRLREKRLRKQKRSRLNDRENAAH